MLTVLVLLKIKSENLKALIDETLEEARTSLQDPGVVQIDLRQDSDNAALFTLHEVFQSREVGLQHLEMAHFKQWQSELKPMLVGLPHATTYEHVAAKR